MEDYMAPAFYITSPIDDYAQNSIFINASTDTSSLRYFTRWRTRASPATFTRR